MAVAGPRHGALALAVLCVFAVLTAPASGVGAESEPSAALRSLTGGPSVDARRVLVLYDDVRLKETHSIFFKQIAGKG